LSWPHAEQKANDLCYSVLFKIITEIKYLNSPYPSDDQNHINGHNLVRFQSYADEDLNA